MAEQGFEPNISIYLPKQAKVKPTFPVSLFFLCHQLLGDEFNTIEIEK